MGKWVRCTSDECAGGGNTQLVHAQVVVGRVQYAAAWWDGCNMQLHGGTDAICSCMVGRMQYAAAWWDGCNMQLHGGTDAICSCMVGRVRYAAVGCWAAAAMAAHNQ